MLLRAVFLCCIIRLTASSSTASDSFVTVKMTQKCVKLHSTLHHNVRIVIRLENEPLKCNLLRSLSLIISRALESNRFRSPLHDQSSSITASNTYKYANCYTMSTLYTLQYSNLYFSSVYTTTLSAALHNHILHNHIHCLLQVRTCWTLEFQLICD